MNSGVKRKSLQEGDAADTLKRKQHAQERWKILTKTIKGYCASDTQQSSVSVRRFQSFGLFTTRRREAVAFETSEEASWYTYSFMAQPGITITMRHMSETIKPADLLGFNNTGNVCVWPSEEVMTHYCLQRLGEFRGTNVIELGGGMTSLAGVAVAVCSEAQQVMLTDGNEKSLTNLHSVIKANDCEGTDVQARLLRWGPEPVEQDMQERFDFVLCADCFFFEDGRQQLVETINDLLKPGGKAWMFAPSRNQTFDKFCELAKDTFQLTRLEQYDDAVWNLHLEVKESSEEYEEDLHYPLFVELVKCGGQHKGSRDTTPESR